ncbi:MAG TPA: TraR/DksA family transcriptional regulator [Bacteroidetes bacterium]|nr:TraR/DksA family transcriptional regulator [Bacteroidota bacterium]
MDKKNTINRYPDSELEEFRAIIEKKLAKAKEEMAYYEQQILDTTANGGDDHGGDWMDDSNTNSDMEFLNNMAIRQKKYINDLENALIRIRNKSYGICMVTGELIDKRRLLVQPIATKSVALKNARPAPKPRYNRSIK